MLIKDKLIELLNKVRPRNPRIETILAPTDDDELIADNIINIFGGLLVQEDDLGRRKLMKPISSKQDGPILTINFETKEITAADTESSKLWELISEFDSIFEEVK